MKRLLNDGSLTIFEYEAWFNSPLILLNERLMFSKTMRVIETLIKDMEGVSAIGVFRWKRGDENLIKFTRRVGYIPNESFWGDAVSEYIEAVRPADEIAPTRRPRLLVRFAEVFSVPFDARVYSAEIFLSHLYPIHLSRLLFP